jgi:hypothetical protein
VKPYRGQLSHSNILSITDFPYNCGEIWDCWQMLGGWSVKIQLKDSGAPAVDYAIA